MVRTTQTAQQVNVPFYLDNRLGPNQAQILLVMCDFTIELRGTFAVEVADNRVLITRISIAGDSFTLPFADGFDVEISHLFIQRDPRSNNKIGLLMPGDGTETEIEIDVPLVISMHVHMPNGTQEASFYTTLHLHGTIQGSVVSFQGQFEFQLESYSDIEMKPKPGACYVWLSAASQVKCQITESQVIIDFAQRQSSLVLNGDFLLGLDGLSVQILSMDITGTPYHIPGLLELQNIRIYLDKSRNIQPIGFELIDDQHYEVRARIPARLTGQLYIINMSPQAFTADLSMTMYGDVQLNQTVMLTLDETVAVTIGTGQIYLNISAQIEALAMVSDDPYPLTRERREYYEFLETATANGELEPLQEALQDGDLMARWYAVRGLGLLELPEVLVEVLDDPSTEIRVAALHALRDQMGRVEQSYELLYLVDDRDERILLAALACLAEVADVTTAWRTACEQLRHHRNNVVRCAALQIAGQHPDNETVSWLVEALRDRDPFVQLTAATALFDIDGLSGFEPALTRVHNLIQNEDDMCILMIASLSLGQTRQNKQRSVLGKLLKYNNDPFVNYAAEYALQQILNHEGEYDA